MNQTDSMFTRSAGLTLLSTFVWTLSLIFTGCSDRQGDLPNAPSTTDTETETPETFSFRLLVDGKARYEEPAEGEPSSFEVHAKPGSVLEFEWTEQAGNTVTIGEDHRIEILNDSEDFTLEPIIAAGSPPRFRVLSEVDAFALLTARLWKDEDIVHESQAVSLSITQDPKWTGFSPENAPDGPIEALLVWNDQLIVAGQFNQVGPLPSLGVASWDGQIWAPLADGLAQIRRLFDAGDRIIATTHDSVYQWDGVSWTFLAALPSEKVFSLAWKSSLFAMADTGLYELRETSWIRVVSPGNDISRSVASDGQILVYGDYSEPSPRYMDTCTSILRRDTPGKLIFRQCGISTGFSGPEIVYLAVASGRIVAFFQGDHKPWASEWVEEERWERLAFHGIQTRTLRDFDVFEDRLVFVDEASILFTDAVKSEPFGTVEDGSSIWASAIYQGRIYAAGSFSRIGAGDATPGGTAPVDATNLAYWR